jgi:hypothetical protein
VLGHYTIISLFIKVTWHYNVTEMEEGMMDWSCGYIEERGAYEGILVERFLEKFRFPRCVTSR